MLILSTCLRLEVNWHPSRTYVKNDEKSVAFWSENLYNLLCSTECCNHSPDSYDMVSRRLKCVSNSVCIHTEQKTRDDGKGTRKKRYAMYCSDLVIYLFPCTKSEESRHLIQTTRSVKASLSASPGDLEGQKIATRNRRMIDCVEPFRTSGKAIRNRQLGGQASSRSCRRLRSPFYLLVHAVPWHVRVRIRRPESAIKVQTWSGYLRSRSVVTQSEALFFFWKNKAKNSTTADLTHF
jgi:hypothetical protein